MIEILGVVTHVAAGWLFLLSPTYRGRTLSRWHDESGLQVMQDVVGGVTGMLLSVLLPVFVWWQLKTGF
jgi:hypothetical protein